MEAGLQAWKEKGWLTPRERQPEEIRHLWRVAERDFSDAVDPVTELSLREELAYNAAVKYCLVLIYAEGFRPAPGGDMLHRITEVLPVVLGPSFADVARFLETSREMLARRKKGGRASFSESGMLAACASDVRAAVQAWIHENHADLALRTTD